MHSTVLLKRLFMLPFHTFVMRERQCQVLFMIPYVLLEVDTRIVPRRVRGVTKDTAQHTIQISYTLISKYE